MKILLQERKAEKKGERQKEKGEGGAGQIIYSYTKIGKLLLHAHINVNYTFSTSFNSNT